MKILGAILVNDKRMSTLPAVLLTCLKVKEISSLEIFCFDTEFESIKFAEDNNIKLNIRKRPSPDMSKVTCSYVNFMTGINEVELMQLAYLRNQTLEKANDDGVDYLYFIDSDILLEKDSLKKLLKVKADVVLGWYFHKRLGFDIFKLCSHENIDDKIKEGCAVEAESGGNGGVLFNREIIENVRYDDYHGMKAEDGVFYEKVLEAGYKIKLHFGVFYRHIGDDWSNSAINYAELKSKICGINYYK